MVATAAMVVSSLGYALHHQLCVILFAHGGQPLEKTDRRPDFLVAVIAPGRHAGHLDAVFDGPEKLGRGVKLSGLRKIRRRGIETPRDVAPGNAGRAVADGAMGRKMLDTDDLLRRIVEPRRGLDAGRVHFDRTSARRLQKPTCYRRMRLGGSNVVKAGIECGEAAKQHDKSGDEDGGDDAH